MLADLVVLLPSQLTLLLVDKVLELIIDCLSMFLTVFFFLKQGRSWICRRESLDVATKKIYGGGGWMDVASRRKLDGHLTKLNFANKPTAGFLIEGLISVRFDCIHASSNQHDFSYCSSLIILVRTFLETLKNCHSEPQHFHL